MSDHKEAGVTVDSDSDGAHTAVAAPPKPAPARPRPRQLPPFKVLLHNDDVNTVEHVILTIMKLLGISVEDALEKTVEAQNRGLALLLVTHKERAELYQEQFATFKLTVTIEPDA